jgi:hypothetical protein
VSFDSAEYWRKRYAKGGNSGAGSYGALAEFKAASFNSFISENSIHSAIEYGSGDGNQLTYLQIESYLGLDVSEVAVENLKQRFSSDPSKKFLAYDPDNFLPGVEYQADIAISMDVILHLTEDFRYERYMSNLVSSARKFIGIFNTATETQLEKMAQHNRYRDHRLWMSENASHWKEIQVDLTPPELGYPMNTGFYFYSN